MKRLILSSLFVAVLGLIVEVQDEGRSFTVSAALPDLTTKARVEQVISHETWQPFHSPGVKPFASRTAAALTIASISFCLYPFSLFPASCNSSRIPARPDIDPPSFELVKILQKMSVWHQSPDEDEHLA